MNCTDRGFSFCNENLTAKTTCGWQFVQSVKRQMNTGRES